MKDTKSSMRRFPSPTLVVLVIMFIELASLFMDPIVVLAEPRAQLVDRTCGPYKQNATAFVPNTVATADKIKSQIDSARFAAAATGSDPDSCYLMFQCHGDLTQDDCTLCYAQARTLLPLCFPFNGGLIFFDGCFMRAQNYSFYEEWTGPRDKSVCGGNGTRKVPPAAFESTVRKVVGRTVAEAVRGNGYARAEKRSTRSNESAFVLANCWRTLSKGSCRQCLEAASALALGCLPWSEGRALKVGCFLRYSDVNFLNPKPRNVNSRAKRLILVLIMVISCSVVLVAGGVIALYKWRERKIQKRRGSTNVKKWVKILHDSSLHFEFSTLEKATGSFDNAHKLGQGGYGAVYKGVLGDGREIAVKRLFFHNRHRVADFFNEVNIISCMQHKNLVRLLGCSCSGPESLLVYEFMANKSLDRHIFDSNKGKTVNWEKRYEIIIGTAEGLVYLHENTQIRILHRDIKASNILLDSKFHAKIADFGLARSFQDNKSHISTAIAGTLGYMAPEYIANGQLTEKADVYSFGVVLLEILTGRQNNGGTQTSESSYTPSLVVTVWKDFLLGTVEELFDPNILLHNENGKHIKDEVFRMFHIGLLCTQENPSFRPTMSMALQMLKKDIESLPSPTNPPFMDEQTMEFQQLDAYSSDTSVAVMSHSSLYPR